LIAARTCVASDVADAHHGADRGAEAREDLIDDLVSHALGQVLRGLHARSENVLVALANPGNDFLTGEDPGLPASLARNRVRALKNFLLVVPQFVRALAQLCQFLAALA
jgi:hypothetical protein